jgi:hypothetical protein
VGGGGSVGVLAEVTVRAGAFDRDHTPVSFDYPAGKDQAFALRGADGTELPLQVDTEGRATFILPALAAGSTAIFSLVLAAPLPSGGPTAVQMAEAIRLSVGERPVAEFRTVPKAPDGIDKVYARAGYLHPVFTPGGTVLTDHYPPGDEEGGHEWHHGIWTAWTAAVFKGHPVDFWNLYKKEGRVDLASVSGTWQGPVHAGVDAKLIHVDLFGGVETTALNERWVVRVYRTHADSAPYFVFDLESTQTAATADPVTLLEYDYGGIAMRVRREWRDEPTLANFTASDGLNRTTGNGQPGRWCFLGGSLAGKSIGLAALGHPSNFKAPQKMRIHDLVPYMAFAPVRDGEFTIEEEEPYVTRMRYVTADGEPDAVLLDRLWNDFASPPEVTVSAP